MSNHPSTPQFINSVLKPGNSPPTLVQQTVDPYALRQIRRHKKSRRGCVACKLRKVKCDERQPCSRCIKRGVQCMPPLRKDIVSPQARLGSYLEVDTNPQMSLLQLELFHHWDKQTRSTLLFPVIWPVIMQQAFDEHFIMTAILCTSAIHMSTLCPQSARYFQVAVKLIPKTISLFRASLSKPLTKSNSEAIMGVGLLINYISWSDLSFLDGARTLSSLARDQLFLLSSGILHAWFQAIPILIDEKSVFRKIMDRHPRRKVEQALAKRGNNRELFMKPLMDIWDDPRFQTSEEDVATDSSVHEPATIGAWNFLQGLERELLPADSLRKSMAEPYDGAEQLQCFKKTITKIATSSNSVDNTVTSPPLPQPLQDRTSFEYIVRRMSPLFCCQTLATEHDIMALHEEFEEFFYGFPILCCGPFTRLVQTRDSRVLVFLFHFYRSARMLLDPKRCWWAKTRSCIMEQRILQELDIRGLRTSLRGHNCYLSSL